MCILDRSKINAKAAIAAPEMFHNMCLRAGPIILLRIYADNLECVTSGLDLISHAMELHEHTAINEVAVTFLKI